MKNIVFLRVEKWKQEYLKEGLKDLDLSLRFFKENISKVNLDDIKDAHVLCPSIYSEIDKEVLDSLKNLELVTTRSTGFDHIDTEECKKRSIAVSNTPHYSDNTVAEHTFALLLTLSRKIKGSMDRVENLEFNLDGLRGFDLEGKTIGVAGTGNIGQHVCRIAHGFGMKIVAFDLKENKSLIDNYGVEYMKFDDLLSQSDVISLHLPLNEHTQDIINEENVEKIKKGAVLINTARGELVSSQILSKALDQGILSWVGLDVLEEEQFIRDEKEMLQGRDMDKKHDLKAVLETHILMEDPRVVVTPHNAFNSDESILRRLNRTIENIKKFLEGETINSVI